MDLSRLLAPLDEPLAVADTNHNKRPRTEQPLAVLPPAIVRDIFASVVTTIERSEASIEPPVVLPDRLRAAACVSKEWNALAHDVTAEIALSRLRYWVDEPTRTELLELRRCVTLYSKYLQSLQIETLPLFVELGDDQWEAVFCLVPRLKVINLKLVREHALPQLAEILRAATRQCHEVETLGFPSAMPMHPKQSSQKALKEFQEALYAALGAWSKNGHRTGVRRLKVGMHDYTTDVASACAYVDKLITLCPSVERLDGYKCSLTDDEEMEADEQWLLDIPTWTTFCTKLTKLTRFEWASVPFATTFFEIFGQFPKPHLKRMKMTPLTNWKWDLQLRGVDPTTRDALTEKGYGSQAVKACEALRACPNLEVLDVRWSFSVHEYDRETDEELPMKKIMNPEIFGDDFCEALAVHCPKLREFQLAPLVEDSESNRVIQSFTDRGFRSLARLPFLLDVDIEGASITGAGLYALVFEHDGSQCSARREYRISVGEPDHNGDIHPFYQILDEFLQLVADHTGEPLGATHTVVLRLTNKTPTAINRVWSKIFLKDTTALIDKIKAIYPTARITLTTAGYKRHTGELARIEDLAFSIGPTPEPVLRAQPLEKITDVVWNVVADEEPEHIAMLRSFVADGGHDVAGIFLRMFGDGL